MNKQTTAIVSGVVGALLGSGLTYVITNNIIRKRYETWANSEIHDVREYYKKLDQEEYSRPTTEIQTISTEDVEAIMAARAEQAEQAPGYVDYTKPKERVSAFDRGLQIDGDGLIISESTAVAANHPSDDEPDFTLKQYERIEGTPYLITQDEYTDEDDYNKEALKYYALDNVLVGPDRIPINNPDIAIGHRHFDYFGWGSHDTNLVYVRNDETETDYEILELQAEYAHDVMGMPSALDDETPIRRFRRKSGDDES